MRTAPDGYGYGGYGEYLPYYDYREPPPPTTQAATRPGQNIGYGPPLPVTPPSTGGSAPPPANVAGQNAGINGPIEEFYQLYAQDPNLAYLWSQTPRGATAFGANQLAVDQFLAGRGTDRPTWAQAGSQAMPALMANPAWTGATGPDAYWSSVLGGANVGSYTNPFAGTPAPTAPVASARQGGTPTSFADFGAPQGTRATGGLAVGGQQAAQAPPSVTGEAQAGTGGARMGGRYWPWSGAQGPAAFGSWRMRR